MQRPHLDCATSLWKPTGISLRLVYPSPLPSRLSTKFMCRHRKYTHHSDLDARHATVNLHKPFHEVTVVEVDALFSSAMVLDHVRVTNEVSEQCRIAASKANQVLGMIRRNITYKDKSLIVPLYKAIVRPHLEYCIQAWSPYLRKDRYA